MFHAFRRGRWLEPTVPCWRPQKVMPRSAKRCLTAAAAAAPSRVSALSKVFSAAAKKTYAKALTRDGAAAAAAVKQRFKDRGITF